MHYYLHQTELLELQCDNRWHFCSNLWTFATRKAFSTYKSLTKRSVRAKRSNCSLHSRICLSNFSWVPFSKYCSWSFSSLCCCQQSIMIRNSFISKFVSISLAFYWFKYILFLISNTVRDLGFQFSYSEIDLFVPTYIF